MSGWVRQSHIKKSFKGAEPLWKTLTENNENDFVNFFKRLDESVQTNVAGQAGDPESR
jgi:hypothetical protein|nr:MAG TPA: hypothetical protein [Caudoviricetes sp.]